MREAKNDATRVVTAMVAGAQDRAVADSGEHDSGSIVPVGPLVLARAWQRTDGLHGAAATRADVEPASGELVVAIAIVGRWRGDRWRGG